MARKKTSQRSGAGTLLQLSKAPSAAWTARSPSSGGLSWTMPTSREEHDGSIERIFCAAVTFWPPMYAGYSRPSSEPTFASAASIAARTFGFEKSLNGSLTNGGSWSSRVIVAVIAGPPEVGPGARGLRAREPARVAQLEPIFNFRSGSEKVDATRACLLD